MQPRKQMVLKTAVGLCMLMLAALCAVFIRDALSQRNPENVLPEMQVYYMGREAGVLLPSASVRRDSYTWRFLVWTKSRPVLDLELWRELHASWVNPNSPLDLAFTFVPKEVLVEVSANEGPFEPLEGELFSPGAEGVYAYRVTASWGASKTVQYYFRIAVPQW